MLAPAHVGHLAMLRSLIRQNAAEGSFDSGLAADSTQSVEFFDKLKRALVHGYFIEEDLQTGRVESVAVPGYVFWPDDRHSGNPPAGFGLFRAIAGGFELWLAALEFGQRGGGHGRTMLDALFATPPGRKTWVVRIPRDSRYRAAVEHLLGMHSFDRVGDTNRLRWFLRSDAPAALAMNVRRAVNGNPSRD
jgi:hypothetical protein